MRTVWSGVIATASFVALSACTTSRPQAQPPAHRSAVVRRPSIASPSEIGVPDLYANGWILSEILVGNIARSVSARTAAAFTVRFEPNQTGPDGVAVFDGECDGSTAQVTNTRIQFTQTWTNLLVVQPGCTNDPHDPSTHAVLGILSGTVTWAITNRELAITNPRTGTLTFTRDN